MHRLFRVAVCCAWVVASVSAAAAAEDPETPKTLLEHFQDQMGDIGNQIINSGSKLRGGAVSLGSDGVALTPAQRCCGQNIEKIQVQMRDLSVTWRELKDCYAARGDADAEIRLNFVRSDAESLLRALGNFAAADQKQVAMGQKAMVKAFLLLRKSVAQLSECGTATVR